LLAVSAVPVEFKLVARDTEPRGDAPGHLNEALLYGLPLPTLEAYQMIVVPGRQTVTNATVSYVDGLNQTLTNERLEGPIDRR
jgi:hypothetical protein